MPGFYEKIKWKFGKEKKSNLPSRNTGLDENLLKKFLVKFSGFSSSQGQSRSEFLVPEYDLEEIERASSADSYIKMALMKYSCLIYKAGYQLKSDNDKAVDYLKLRFRLMSLSTKKPMDILFQEIADDMVKYSNAFIIKARGDLIYPGVKAKAAFGKKPVLGYFRVDPTTIKIKRDKHGTILCYRQVSEDGEEKEFAPSDVIHMYLDREGGNAYGTPRISAALEDVKLLRRIEGNVMALIYRFAIPIFHFKVGVPQAGQTASETEIRDLQREIENMSLDGMIFTNERTEVKAVGAEGNALDTSGPLNYFEKRVFSALGVSESQMGRGNGKQETDSVEAQMHDTVKYIQRTIAAFLNNDVIMELLLEGGFDPIRKEEDIVSYVFNEISLDTKVKVENHEMLKYQSNLVTIDEARTNMGMKTEFDESRFYAHLVDEKVQLKAKAVDHKNQASIIKMTHELNQASAEKEADINQLAANKNNGNGKDKAITNKGKDIENRNRPENQHGKTSVAIKESYLDKGASTKKKLENHKKNYEHIYKTYINLRNDITENASDVDLVFSAGLNILMEQIEESLILAASEGVERLTEDCLKLDVYAAPISVQSLLDPFIGEAKKDLTQLLKDIKGRLNSDRTNGDVVFDALQYRLRFLLEYYTRKVLWYAYIKAAKENGIKEVSVKFSSEKDAENRDNVIKTNHFDFSDIPAFHAFCNCELSIRQVKK